ncbi:hypothetical protein O0555_05335 [Brevibacillus laterosporus]|uniref:hypothetical protein n=1 Tax=Brevibacillus laterosporus TaxID=1465 RepID=UPI0015E23ACB|nr:hypothetical protein [Brevibacillus laterosporus]MCR8936772.1 hypothetical protein [Brevibacillus laterosporus]MCZ0839411.1 hypothetical protein [Brevibacillus laterosporus]MCZ0846848.1 hypothetical protein [Brevibacillus laterosporus]MED1912081.1 hypothetical protein [Brevibacillus laterosporus]
MILTKPKALSQIQADREQKEISPELVVAYEAIAQLYEKITTLQEALDHWKGGEE